MAAPRVQETVTGLGVAVKVAGGALTDRVTGTFKAVPPAGVRTSVAV